MKLTTGLTTLNVALIAVTTSSTMSGEAIAMGETAPRNLQMLCGALKKTKYEPFCKSYCFPGAPAPPKGYDDRRRRLAGHRRRLSKKDPLKICRKHCRPECMSAPAPGGVPAAGGGTNNAGANANANANTTLVVNILNNVSADANANNNPAPQTTTTQV